MAKPAPKISGDAVLAAQGGIVTRSWVQLQIAKDSNDLRKKATALLRESGDITVKGAKSGGKLLLNDVLQATFIMIAAAVAQVTKDRLERDHLAAGYKPTYEEVKTEAVRTTSQLLCGGEPSAVSEVLCSGEIWVGTAGGWVARVGLELTVMKVMQRLLAVSPARAAVIQLIGTLATSFLMLAGFSMSGYLWTQAVYVLNDPAKEEMAHKAFGRAAEMWLTGRWSEYVKTPDGQVAAQVFENMKNILLVDSAQRSAWFDNAWRFGFARGEMIVNITMLMAALSAGAALGTAAGATAAGTAFAAGLTSVGVPSAIAAGAIPFAVATAVGAGIAATIVYMPDLGVGEQITVAIQKTRGFIRRTRHNSVYNHIVNTSEAFNVNRFKDPVTFKYKKRYIRQMEQLLPMLSWERAAWTSVAIERYQELNDKVEEASRTLDLAEEVIKNSEFRKHILLSDGGNVMTYEQAKAKYCKRSAPIRFAFNRANCNFPLAYQLEKIAESKRKIAEAQSTLDYLAEQIVSMYYEDYELFNKILDDTQLAYPPELAATLANTRDTTGALAGAMMWNFGGMHANVRAQYDIPYRDQAEMDMWSVKGRDFVKGYYLSGFQEQDYLQRLMHVLAGGQ